jgi:hypothetical protein
MPPPFLGFLPSEFSPPRRSRASLEVAELPCSYSPACLDAQLDSVHRLFPRRSRFHAIAWFPTRLWVLFPRAETRFPITPRLELRNRLVPLASPASKFSPFCESVHSQVRFPFADWPILSWGFAPLKLSPSTPRILDPPEPEGSNTCPSS